MPANTIPMPADSKDPTRQCVPGLEDYVDRLREHVKALEIDRDLITFILSELDEIKTNAAVIRLHDVEAPGGGFDLHLSIKPKHLGPPIKTKAG